MYSLHQQYFYMPPPWWLGDRSSRLQDALDASGLERPPTPGADVRPAHEVEERMRREAFPPPIDANEDLLRAVITGDTDAASRALAVGASPDTRSVDSSDTVVHLAVRLAGRTGNTSMLNLLLENGANPEITTRALETPLHECALTGTPEAANLLLVAGAHPARQDAAGRTPIDLALRLKVAKQLPVVVHLNRASVSKGYPDREPAIVHALGRSDAGRSSRSA